MHSRTRFAVSSLIAAFCAPEAAGQVPLLLDEDVQGSWQAPHPADLERTQALIGMHVRGERLYFAGLTIPDFDQTHSSYAHKIPRTFASAQDASGATIWEVVYPEAYLDGIQFAVSSDGTALILAGRDAQGVGFVRRLDQEDGQVLWHTELPLSPDKVVSAMPSLAVSSDGARIAVALAESGYEGAAYVTRHSVVCLAGGGNLLFSSILPEAFETQDVELSGNGQRLFIASQKSFFGSYRCLDSTSGAALWAQEGPSFVPTSLASSADGQRLYAAQILPSCGGQSTLKALDGDGNPLWSRTFTDCLDAWLFDEATGRLFLNTLSTGLAGGTMAIGGTDGGTLWSQPHSVKIAQPFYTTSRIGYDRFHDWLYVVFDGVLTQGPPNNLWSAAFAASSGDLLWSRFDPITTGEPFAYLEDIAALPSADAVIGFPQFYPDQNRDLIFRRLAGDNGEVLLEEQVVVEYGTAIARAVGANFSAVPQAWEDLVYAVLETDSSLLSVRAFEPLTGQLRWSHFLAGGNFDSGEPQRGARHLFATQVNRILCARNEQPGLGDTEILGLYADTGYPKFRRSNPFVGAISAGALNSTQTSAYYAFRTGQPGPFGSVRGGLLALDTDSGSNLFQEAWSTAGDKAELWALAVAPDDARVYFWGNRGNSEGPAQRVALLARDAVSGVKVFDREYDPISLGLSVGEAVRGIALAIEPSGAALHGLVLAGEGLSARLALVELSPVDGAVRSTGLVPLCVGFPPVSAMLVSGATHLAVCADLDVGAGERIACLVGYAYGDPVARYSRGGYFADGSSAALGGARASLDGQRLCLGLGANSARLSILDFASGAELWFAETPDTKGLPLGWPAAPLDLGAVVYAVTGGDEQAGLLLRLVPEALLSGPNALGLSSGGTNVLTLSRPPAAAGQVYILLGSASGTQPGIPLDGQLLPLVPDAYLTATLVSANQGPFKKTLGALDAQGQARMEIVLPSGLSSTLAGTLLSHAALSFSSAGTVEFASAAVTLVLVP
jgi:PQQ-like domain